MPKICLGDDFSNIDALKDACRQYAIEDGFELKTLRSTPTRYEIACKDKDCGWRLRASVVANTSIFRIRSVEREHDCYGLHHESNKEVTASFLSEYIIEKLKDQPEYRPVDIVKDVKRDLGVKITYSKAYRAKEEASAKINGTHESSYSLLPKYCKGIEDNNPGSLARLETTTEFKFKRIFICYSASAKGFAYCRPLLGLDGTHLKSKYQGILLAATAVDATGSLFPLSYPIVDAENDDNWNWFLELLRSVINQNVPEFLKPGILTILSDRQKGLIEGVEHHFPSSPHGYCLRHLEDNFHKVFKNVELKSLLWQAARATTETEFNEATANMDGIDSRASRWLRSHAPADHWAELYFAGRRYGHLTSNIAESLNSWLLVAREMPILPLLETVRHQLMNWFANRRENEKETKGLLVSKVASGIEASLLDRARRYRFIRTSDGKYEVKSKETLQEYIVDLTVRTCRCRDWKAQGYPCGHALAVILGRKENPQTYADDCFTLEAYKNTYKGIINHPCDDDFGRPLSPPTFEDGESRNGSESESEKEEEGEILPPNTRRPTGRPKKRRLRTNLENQADKRRAITCSRCHAPGHSRRTCREAI